MVEVTYAEVWMAVAIIVAFFVALFILSKLG